MGPIEWNHGMEFDITCLRPMYMYTGGVTKRERERERERASERACVRACVCVFGVCVWVVWCGCTCVL